MTNQAGGLRFDVYERVHLPEEAASIDELEEIELTPQIQVEELGEQVFLKGHLLLTGVYRAQTEQADIQSLKHLIPVEITLPMNRVSRLDEISVEIDNFDADVLSARTINITGVLSLYGIEVEQAQETNRWQEEPFTVVHRREDEADSEELQQHSREPEQPAQLEKSEELPEVASIEEEGVAEVSGWDEPAGIFKASHEREVIERQESERQREQEQEQEQEEAILREREAAAKLEREKAELEAARREWMEREREAQLREAEQREAAQREAQLREAERREAEQREAQQREAQQREAQQREAEQREAQLREAEQREAEQREAELREAEQREAEQREAELREAEQREVELREAEQREVELREAAQREAQLREAEQREAQLREAEQREAQLREAEQREAEQREAERLEAEQREAELREAELREATLRQAAEDQRRQQEADRQEELAKKQKAAVSSPTADEKAEAEAVEASELAADAKSQQEPAEQESSSLQYAMNEPEEANVSNERQEMRVALGTKRSSGESETASGGVGFRSLLQSSIREQEARNAAEEQAAKAKPEPIEEVAGEEIEWKSLFLNRPSDENSFSKVRICIVQREETLELIAGRYQLQPRELALYNRLADQTVAVGQVLYIPK
ncbi:LysM peptidoglycan-binding domain-containing protein [Paenibacillus sp. GCM10027626]|uniref:LysM peptidoglycan-binding domain-containing protein n=1 Tax=Paenibacillus sp. GCM10027626 TaxID=3273411 RepID=UPI00362A0CD4